MTNAGDIIKKQCLNLTKNPVYGTTTHLDEQYWKQITEYPISANLTIKGLIKPAMLGEYVKVNTVFYGQEDLGSGLYLVTAQKDTLTSGGYRTTLELLRVGDSTKIYG